jgi:hypothetical protein
MKGTIWLSHWLSTPTPHRKAVEVTVTITIIIIRMVFVSLIHPFRQLALVFGLWVLLSSAEVANL